MEFKVRAWHKAHKKMFNILGLYAMGSKKITKVQLQGQNNMIPVSCVVLMPYTGICDKHGTEIYLGHIIPYHFNESIKGVVKFGEYRNPFGDDIHGGHVGFYVDFPNRIDLRKDLGYWAKISCVEGNIYENGGNEDIVDERI